MTGTIARKTLYHRITRRRVRWAWFVAILVGLVLLAPGGPGAQAGPPAATAESSPAPGGSHGPGPTVPAYGDQHDHTRLTADTLLAILLILVGAKLGGEAFERMGQPPVIGEILLGLVVGNLSLLGIGGLGYIKDSDIIAVFSEIGVILLLFQVGLDSNLAEMARVGLSSLLVAILGVVAPLILGFGVGVWFIPEASWLTHLFLGATLCATSVGITARVLGDMGCIQTQEARIILGAAVLDDVLGLIVLSIVSGLIGATARGEAMSMGTVVLIMLKAGVFLLGAILVGGPVGNRFFGLATRLRSRGLLVPFSLAFCFLFSYLAYLFGLAFIVGAFAAGLVLEDVKFREPPEKGSHGTGDDRRNTDRRATSLEEVMAPIAQFLVPLFFVKAGMDVDLSTLTSARTLQFAMVLTLVAVLGKQVCAFGVREPGASGLAVGLGMIPRGEVGLIFANIGVTMKLADGSPVLDPATFGAVVFMVGATTMLTPPLLKWALARRGDEGTPHGTRTPDSPT